jgi:hypothetical protein
MATPSNSDDYIDSRDVIARIEELDACDSLDVEELEELETLRKLADEGEGLADWQYGETLIRDSYFVDYARDLAEDIGAIDRDAWPLGYIDWDAAANALLMDYTSIEFDGVTYWGRS